METHKISFEEFDFIVDVYDGGSVSIQFENPEGVIIGMKWDDFREAIDFTAVHGLKMSAPYVVEYDEIKEDSLSR